MNAPANKIFPTRLSDSQYEECMGIALHYLKSNPIIRNRDIREVASIGYDQAIRFFNRAIAQKRLIRKGNGSGTRHVLPATHEVL
jgi:hypothetical protein